MRQMTSPTRVPHAATPPASPAPAPTTASPFAPIDEVLADLRAGKMIVLTDDERRENEGDLVQAAEFVTPESITFMLREAKGYMCLSLTERDCERLELPPQASVNTSVRGTAFTVSIDGHPRHGFTTGVSAKERARCIRMAIDPALGPDDFVRPGHINPLRSRDGGVLVRTGQTEGSVDLCRLAGLKPAAVIIEIMRDDGEMARVPDLVTFCAQHQIKMCSVAQIIHHRLARESLVRRAEPVRGTPVRTPEGVFTLYEFESLVDPLPHVALCAGGVGELDALGRPVELASPTLVRMHRRSFLGDVFGVGEVGGTPVGTAVGSGIGSSGDVLRASLRAIAREGRGVLVYLRPEGRDDTLDGRLNRLRAGSGTQTSPDSGDDDPHLRSTQGQGAAASVGGLPRAMRDFGVGGQILRSLGVGPMRLLTNHATELPGLEAFGLTIVERVAIRDEPLT